MKKKAADFKKGIVGILFFTFLLLIMPSFVQAQENQSDPIDDAYSCLADKVDDRCSVLSTEEKVFSLLAINQCEDELIEDSSDGDCWPSGDCSLKTTAQSALALSNAGGNVDSAQEWIISQNRSAPGLTWYLQIESPEVTQCSLGYRGFSYNINLNEDKTIEGNPGPAFTIDEEGYWLRVDTNYYGTDFEISCNQDFLTGLLFRKSLSSTVHVFSGSSSSAAGGITTERVESLCFQEGGVCNYEGSLWATFVLKNLGEDISSHLPYLVTMAEDNQRLLPDAFLYAITSDENYRTSLLSKQLGNQRWEVSGDRYYDTALALYPFQSETLTEKENSKDWLIDVQDADGCWGGGNIRNTAFILESVWPRSFGSSPGDNGGETPIGCEDSGNYCVPSGQCSGAILDQECSGSFSSLCCSEPVQQDTCADLGGEICSFNEVCRQGESTSAADTSSGEVCCVGGFCEEKQEPQISECEEQNGVCRIGDCRDNEESATYACSISGDTCCVSSTGGPSTPNKGLTWVWILSILIILVIVGIVFRDNLRHFWLRIKSKFGGSKGKSSGSGGPGRPFGPGSGFPSSSFPRRRPISGRRIVPRPHSSPSGHSQKTERKSGASKELDDVLKKLKEMGQ